MADLLDKYRQKATKMSDLKTQDRMSGYSKGGDVNYLTVDDGENRFRIFPPHANGGKTFCEPKCVSWLSLEVEEYEGGKKTGEKKIKRKPVMNSIVHSGGLIDKDLIDSYVAYAEKRFEEMFESEADRKTAMEKIRDNRTGVASKRSWAMYAYKYIQSKPIFGLLEISNGTKKKVNELILTLDSAENPLATDPLSDIDEGICLIINKKGAGLQTEYSVDFHSSRKSKFSVDLIPTPLTIDDLTTLESHKSLKDTFFGVFTDRMFSQQLEGLQRFDEESGFNFMQEEAFIQEMESISDLVGKFAKKYEPKVQAEEKEETKEEEVKKLPKTSVKSFKVEAKEEEVETENEEEPFEADYEVEEKSEEQPKVESAADKLAKIKAQMEARRNKGV